ncbi:hypothetical protein GH714_023269 [Hevea brasiliensis]|uniref:Uncharacterized protein n=1 Tax=Hevea brasiliensis TaxID=3981 RepID=A0A6A6LUE4_HEVBR|nr:hypothetical protein GH714_023269 [Hevea brasiliensis]
MRGVPGKAELNLAGSSSLNSLIMQFISSDMASGIEMHLIQKALTTLEADDNLVMDSQGQQAAKDHWFTGQWPHTEGNIG